MPVYRLDDVRPEIHPAAFVHPDAVVIGAVTIGADASVWPGAVLRGDYGSITIGERTSVQDGSVIHATAENPTVIGADCVIGHTAHLEGCVVDPKCLIGSHAVVLHDVLVGSESVVAAGAVVTHGMQIPMNSLVAGVPARVLSSQRSFEDFRETVEEYVRNARRYETSLREVIEVASEHGVVRTWRGAPMEISDVAGH